MKPTNDMHRLIKKLRIKASTELDRRVHNDISQALAESEPVATESIIWKFIMRRLVMKLAVAAAIIIAFGIGFAVGRRSKPIRSAAYSIEVTGYTSAVSSHPTATKVEDSFWRQKALAAMQPRPYTHSHFDKTNLLNTYKQYLKEKRYD